MRGSANAAHQLRTPIMAIVGAAELLATGGGRGPNHKETPLNHIFSEGRRLQRLSEVLLRLSRIGWDRREPDLDIVDLGEAGQQVTSRWSRSLRAAGLWILNEGEALAYALIPNGSRKCLWSCSATLYSTLTGAETSKFVQGLARLP